MKDDNLLLKDVLPPDPFADMGIVRPVTSNVKFEVYKFKSDSTMNILFRQTIEIPIDKCPFQDIINVLKILYPKSNGVIINVMD